MVDGKDTTTDLDERLKAAEDRKATRQAKADQEEKRRRIAVLELEELLEEKLGGAAGEAFTIVEAWPEGLLAFRVGEAVLYKQFNAEIEKNKEKRGGDGITPEACQRFVAPLLVYPEDKGEFLGICERRHGVLFRAAGAVSTLYSAKRSEEDAKR